MNPTFSPRAVLGVIVFGALAFLAMLWFIGQGDTNSGADNGEAHAASHGLTGFAALADMLEAQGYDVSLSRNQADLDEEGLLILTPGIWADADDVAAIIEQRRYTGPTLLILPKWYAMRAPSRARGARKGWVVLGGAVEPEWTDDFKDTLKMEVALARGSKAAPEWQGLGLRGTLPVDKERAVVGLENGAFSSLVRDGNGRDVVAYTDDGGCYPLLDKAAGYAPRDDCEVDEWNLTVVFDPDLFNNYGLADRNRALLAAKVIDLAREGEDIPVVFDLTLAGLGGAKNLATLAFAPPFLAATLCLLLALAVTGWRAFGRFGPPLAEGRAIAFGKTRLAANAGGFVRRSGRLHLLAEPYAALVARRIAAALGLRNPDPATLDAAIARRGHHGPAFSDLANALETARGPAATLRAAHALYALEKDLTP